MYYWGSFKYDYRAHGPIQYVEEHDQKLAEEARAWSPMGAPTSP